MKTKLGILNISIDIEFDSTTSEISTSYTESMEPTPPTTDRRRVDVGKKRNKYRIRNKKINGFPYSKWSESEKIDLLEFVSHEEDIEEIAKHFNRTIPSIYSAISRFDIYEKIKKLDKDSSNEIT